MKLTRIHLENFRCFGTTELDLTRPDGDEPLDTVLFVGGNGTGKTSVLAAIGGLFTTAMGLYRGDPLSVQDVRDGTDMARIRVDWRERDGGKHIQLSAVVGILRKAMDVEAQAHGAGVQLMGSEFDVTAYNKWSQELQDKSRRDSGLMTLFDVYRLLPPHQVAGPNVQHVVTHRLDGALTPTVRRSGALEQRFRQLKQWIVNLDFYRAKAKADRSEESPTWETLCSALNTIFDPYRFDGVDEQFEVMFRTPTGRVPIETLSDGFRSVFVIVTELLLRLSLSTDDPNRILQQEAVCLIDEVDAHLHPRWQETALPGLRALFPRVQFIATTHSPIVVTTVSPHSIFRFEQQEK